MRTPEQFKLTLEQRQILGKVYMMILSWREPRKRREVEQGDHRAENDVRDDQILLAETAIPVQQGT